MATKSYTISASWKSPGTIQYTVTCNTSTTSSVCAGLWLDKTKAQAQQSTAGTIFTYAYGAHSGFPRSGSRSGTVAASAGSSHTLYFGAGWGKYVGPWDSSHRAFTNDSGDLFTIGAYTYSVVVNIRNQDCYGEYGDAWTWVNTTAVHGSSYSNTIYTDDAIYNAQSVSWTDITSAKSTTLDCSRKSGAFSLNILLPDGSEPDPTGEAGTVEFSDDEGSSYSRVSDEPTNSYLVERPFRLRNFIPGTGLHYDSISGVSEDGSGSISSPWTASQTTDGISISISTAWNTYTVKFNANGGTGTTSDQEFTYNTAQNLRSNGFSRSGYDFLGWSTSNTATSPTYTNEQSVKNLTATDKEIVTLYAVWRETKPSNAVINGSVIDPFTINTNWSATGVNVSYTLYYKKQDESSYTTIDMGSSTSKTLTVAEETTYNIYVSTTNLGGTTNSNTITLTTPADQAKIRIKRNGNWSKGKIYFKKNGQWAKAKKIYIKKNGNWVIGNNYDPE